METAKIISVIERRPDCSSFKPKTYSGECGDCQTDGHYLCAGCRHIADYDSMELQDNRLRYYGGRELAAIEKQTMSDIYNDPRWHSWKCNCGCLNNRGNGNCARCGGMTNSKCMFYGKDNYHSPLGRAPYNGTY